MSFCRITGKARGLPKPNYFPLLPPISPADAKRFCRITGKAFGLPGHHYTPVLLVRQSRRKACTVTGGAAGGNEKHHFPAGPKAGTAPNTEASSPEEPLQPQRHVVVTDFRYVFPTLEESTELGEIMSSQKENAPKLPVEEQDRRFVYTVADRRCSLVIPARLEAAVREGEVKGVLLADDSDEVKFQFREGKDVTVGVKDLEAPKEQELWEGEGPSQAAQQALAAEASEPKPKPKKKRKKNDGLSCMTKIFEEKERVQDVEFQKTEEIKAKRAKVVEVKLSTTESDSSASMATTEDVASGTAATATALEAATASTGGNMLPEPQRVEWHQFDPNHHRVDTNLVMCSGDWRDLVKPLIESWDWDEFEREAAAVAQGAAVVTQLPRPVALRADTSLQELQPTTTPAPDAAAAIAAVTAVAGVLPIATAVAPLAPLVAQPSAEVQVAVKAIPKKALSRTSAVATVLQKDEAARNLLPTVEEIPQLVASLDQGKAGKIGAKANGLMLDIGAAKKFVAGQTVNTPAGPVFVPGQTLDTPAGPEFVPGMTVMTEHGPLLIPGQKVDTPAAGPAFVAGRLLKTMNGDERFVAGQTIVTPDGPVFMPGQTVITAEGPKFIPGQTIIPAEGSNAPAKFVPGHTVVTPEGPPKFMPGQTLAAPDGSVMFVPGQNILDATTNTWEFVPGEVQPGPKGEMQFVAGQTIPTAEGPKFVPGRTVASPTGAAEFVPGVTVQEVDGSLRFVPGRTVQTAEGPKFVEGHVVQTEKGPVFAPGRLEKSTTEGEAPKFNLAKCLQDAVLTDAAATAAAAIVTEEEPAGEAVFGHMVQTGKGVAFFPGTRAAGLPAGKLVPGRLLRSSTSGDVKFIPGIEVFEDNVRRFVPGQVVETERGEQFVPGQVVDTADGPKFVPGQVVETRNGHKFVPGQTVDTPEGPKFVPGQIVDTKAGPTFIPGQVISTTEEGSRFVPGQVVETAEGPRFVPGRVVETGDKVTFVPGQVVETKEGLRFVAPDLADGCEFSVQGFEISPEELKLIRPHGGATTTSSEAVVLDSNVLKQLSEAGVAVGRHVPADLPGVAVAENAILTSETVHKLSSQLELESDKTMLLADVLGTVVRLSTELLEQARSTKDLQRLKEAAVDSTQGCDDSVKEFVRTLVSAVALTASQHPYGEILHCAGDVVGELLLGVDPMTAATLVQSLHAFLSAPGAVRDLRNDARAFLRAECKIDLLRTLVAESFPDAASEEGACATVTLDLEEDRAVAAVGRLAAVLGDQGREEVLGEAFTRLSEGRPQLVGRVLGKVSQNASNVVTERDASETVQRAIVSAVRESSERQLKAILDLDESMVSEETEEEMRSLLGEAVGLARALGMFDAADALVDVLDDAVTTRALALDDIAMDVLHRLTVMRSLAARRPAHAAALRRLHEDPFDAREDPHLRELVRDSAVLLVEPQSVPMLNSVADVPASLLLADNRLAVEDFLARSGHRAGPLLILKPGLQTVIPREASRAVLTGQCSYTVLDNHGIKYFEPLHVLSALRLPRVATHRFTMYRCAVAGNDGSSMTSSSDDLAGSFSSGQPADSLLGGSFASTTTASTAARRRSSGAPLGQQLAAARRASLDTGTGTATATATASPSSDGPEISPPLLLEPRLRRCSGYLDADTRRRIANALAYGDPLPKKRPNLSARSLESSPSPSPVRSPSPPPTRSRRVSRRASKKISPLRSPSPVSGRVLGLISSNCFSNGPKEISPTRLNNVSPIRLRDSSPTRKEKSSAKPSSPTQVKPSSPAKVKPSSPTKVRPSLPTQVKPLSPTQDDPSPPARVKQASPTRVKQASPTRVKQASPTRVKQASPTRVKQASPTRVKQPSPTRMSPSPVFSSLLARSNGTTDISKEAYNVSPARSPSPPVARRLSRVLKRNIAATDIKGASPPPSLVSRDSSPESPMTKDYNKLIDYKESSPLRRLSTKYASFLNRQPTPEKESVPEPKQMTKAIVNNHKNELPSRESSPHSSKLDDRELSPVGYGTRTTARTVRESSFDDELTPNQRRILKELRVNHLATLRAKELYKTPSRENSPTSLAAPSTLPRFLRDISPLRSSDNYINSLQDNEYTIPKTTPHISYSKKREPKSKQKSKRQYSPVRYVPRDVSPVRPISSYMPQTYRSRERGRGDSRENSPSGVSLRTARLLKKLSPQARTLKSYNSDKSPSGRGVNSYRSEDLSPSSRGVNSYRSEDPSPSSRGVNSYRSEDPSPSSRMMNSYDSSPVGRKSSFRASDAPASRGIGYYRTKDSSPSSRVVNSYRSKDSSPSTRSCSRDSSPLTFVPRRTQIRLPDLSPPRNYYPSSMDNDDDPVIYRRQSDDAISPLPARRQYGLQRHNTDITPRVSHLYRSPGESASKPPSRTYRLEPLGGSSYHSGRGVSPSDALRFDSVSPTEPLSLGSFRTESENGSVGRAGSASPDDPGPTSASSYGAPAFTPTPATAQT